MNIDKLLAHFSIQTKVVVLVIPLIAGIAGLATINFYTGSMLGGRLTGASASIETLSAFKKAYADMNDFLQLATREKRDEVIVDLDKQVAKFDNIQHLANSPEESAALQEARTIAATLRDRVNELWNIQVAETTSRDRINSTLQLVSDAKERMDRKAAELAVTIANNENAARDMLFAAGKLANGSVAITTIVNGISRSRTPEDMFAIARENEPQFQRLLTEVLPVIPDEKVQMRETIKASLNGFIDVLEMGNPGQAEADKLKKLAIEIQPAGNFLRDMSAESARQGTARISKLNGVVVESRSLVRQTGKVIKTGSELEVAIVQFLREPTEQRLAELDLKSARLTERLEKVALFKGGDQVIESFGESPMEEIKLLLPLGQHLMQKIDARRSAFDHASEQINEAWSNIIVFADSQQLGANVTKQRATGITVGAATFAVIFGLLASAVLIAALRSPIRRLVEAMRNVASGDLGVNITDSTRTDEIGEMARALDVFKANAIDKIHAENESEQARETATLARQKSDTEKAMADEQIRFAVHALGTALQNLSKGDLVTTIDTPFAGELDTLRIDFNESISRMRDAMERIRDNASSISANSSQLRSAANDLSNRTAQQASSLEETAAAVDQISTTVSTTSGRAAETDKLASDTAGDARASGEIVTRAVDAMGRIEEASGRINRIIGVIDEIAFQTNLLALNAGVEAARAGESGRGFAVVAQEVRELAGRSATAAKEIKELIAHSGEEVRSGVSLVGETGEAITRIITRIQEISDHVGAMATANRDQAAGLDEVNKAINQMDQVTQQNSAMVEQTNASSQTLAQEAEFLSKLVANFRLGLGDKHRNHQHEAA